MSSTTNGGHRKYRVALAALVGTFILAIIVVVRTPAENLSGVPEGWVAAVGLIVGLFGVANAATHYVKRNGK